MDAPNTSTEIWKAVPLRRWELLYEVSSHGRIRRTDNHRIRKVQTSNKGYVRVRLYHGRSRIKGSSQFAAVHRLVALAFHGRPKKGQQVNHKDGVKTHNYQSNIEWVTASENRKHAFRLGLCVAPKGDQHYRHLHPEMWAHSNPPHPIGESHPRAKLTDVNVLEIRRRCAVSENHPALYRALAKKFHVIYGTIYNIHKQKTRTQMTTG